MIRLGLFWGRIQCAVWSVDIVGMSFMFDGAVQNLAQNFWFSKAPKN